MLLHQQGTTNDKKQKIRKKDRLTIEPQTFCCLKSVEIKTMKIQYRFPIIRVTTVSRYTEVCHMSKESGVPHLSVVIRKNNIVIVMVM